MKLSLLCHYEIRLFFYRVAVTLNWIRKELPCFTSTMNRKNKESNISKSTQELETQFEYKSSTVFFFERTLMQKETAVFPSDANKNKITMRFKLVRKFYFETHKRDLFEIPSLYYNHNTSLYDLQFLKTING